MDQVIWDKVQAVDLASVNKKFKDSKGFWWNLWYNPDRIEKEYRQFLYLIATNPGKTVVPWTQDLDDFWHQHILDTAKYKTDCETLCGGVINHNPNLPVGIPEQKKAFSETKQLYRTAFQDEAKKQKGSAGASCSGASCDAMFMPIVFCGGASSCSSGGDCDVGSHSHDSSSCSDTGGSACSSSSDSASSCSGGSSCGGGGGD